jgi:Fe-S cluster assembly iron-binding protein IscA
VITLAPGTGQAIRSKLSETGSIQPIRIDLMSSGCCDPSLGLKPDVALDTDLTEKIDGLTFVISPETYKLVGDVTISYIDEISKKGFSLTSTKPLTEWDGFGVVDICF